MKRLEAAAALAAAPVLALLGPPPGGPLAPLLALVAWAAWACTAWLLLVATLTCGSRVPGRAGRAAASAARCVAPASVRALVRVALGVSLTATVLGGPAALAEDRTPTVAGSATDFLDWPGIAPVTATPEPAPAPPDPVPTATHDQAPAPQPSVLVRSGDSLWALARQHLGPDATDAQVALAWPQWWSANRDVIGGDPDLIHPGDRLTAP